VPRPAHTFRCVTFGCRVNQYETQAIREQLEAIGLVEAREEETADVIVVNSCTVTEEADRECFSQLRKLNRKNPNARLIVTGCLVQRDAERLKPLAGVRLLVGTGQKHRIGEFVRAELGPYLVPEGPGTGFPPRIELEISRVYGGLRISRFEGWDKAFVKVQDGCDRACSFCKIPLVRGRSRSRPLAEVIEEVKRLAERGYREIVLTGVAIGLWGRDLGAGASLAELLAAVDQLSGRFRVRLSSLDPRDLDDRLIRALEASSKVCHHLHLSLQSGSDPVLQRMNRGHTAAEYALRVAAVRRFWPDLGLTTDLIAGFPEETQEQFQQTLSFCRAMEFAKVHVFPYSRRRGTSAAVFKGTLAASVVRERARLLRQTAAEVSARFRERFVGTRQELLLERRTDGTTAQFLRVRLEGGGGTTGELLPVEITGLTPQGLRGKIFPGALDKLHHPVPTLDCKDNLEEVPVTNPVLNRAPRR